MWTGLIPTTGACSSGYSGDLCETDVDECLASPCLNGATCEDRAGSFYCQCQQNNDGQLCESGKFYCQCQLCESSKFRCVNQVSSKVVRVFFSVQTFDSVIRSP